MVAATEELPSGEDLRAVRNLLDLSRATIAHFMKCSVDTVARIERGEGSEGYRQLYLLTLRELRPKDYQNPDYPWLTAKDERSA